VGFFENSTGVIDLDKEKTGYSLGDISSVCIVVVVILFNEFDKFIEIIIIKKKGRKRIVFLFHVETNQQKIKEFFQPFN
jgi:hypothetical protein